MLRGSVLAQFANSQRLILRKAMPRNRWQRGKITGTEGFDYVSCRICGDRRRVISGRHLSKHDTDRLTYMDDYDLSPYRDGDGKQDRLPGLAAELVRQDVAVIVTGDYSIVAPESLTALDHFAISVFIKAAS